MPILMPILVLIVVLILVPILVPIVVLILLHVDVDHSYANVVTNTLLGANGITDASSDVKKWYRDVKDVANADANANADSNVDKCCQ